jgi:hypothetical protein
MAKSRGKPSILLGSRACGFDFPPGDQGNFKKPKQVRRNEGSLNPHELAITSMH